MTNQTMTGYPSIDKPWLKYYSEEVLEAKVPQCSIYENIYNNNCEHSNDIALMFFGKKITYKTLFREIDRTAKALAAHGVKTGDNVALCVPAIPEAIYAILALNKIGANANMLNPTFTEEQLKDRISETEATLLIVANELYSRVSGILEKTSIKTVVSCAAVNSLGPIVKRIKKVKSIPGTIAWNTFLSVGKKIEDVPQPAYKPQRPAIMVYSSGTTGASKGIQLTNDSINSTIYEGVQIGFPWKRGDKWFSQVPIWFSTGICASTLVPLRYGITIMLEPLYDFEIFYQHIIKYKPNFMITACGLLDYLMMKQPESEAYKEFKFLCAGGEYVTKSAEVKYNKWLKQNGNEHGLYKGYGMCECGGTITASSPKCNVSGSAGIPTPNVVIAAFNSNTNTELKYGERGEMRVATPCRMLGYYKNIEATEKYFHTDAQGIVWCCTGDMGYVTEDGNVFVDGRISDSYVNAEGQTIYLFDIERAILDVETVRQCKVVVSNVDGVKTHVAHISLYDSTTSVDNLMESISALCSKRLEEDHFPHHFKVHPNALPVAPSGKLDSKKMIEDITGLIQI